MDQKKSYGVRRIGMIFVAMVLGIMLLVGCGAKKASDDPNLGLYTAQYGSMLGISIEVGDVFGQGFTIDLKEKGKCELFVDGNTAKGTWTLEGDKISLSGGGIDCSGTLSGGVMQLDDVMGTGLTLTLTNASFAGDATEAIPEGSMTESEAGSMISSLGGMAEAMASDTGVEELGDRRTDLQKYWNGDWYGMLIIQDATGDYKAFKNNGYDAFGRVEIDETGDGTLTLWYGYSNGNTYDNPTGKININVSYEAGFGSHGTAISVGGWMFANDETGRVEEMDFVIDPDAADFPDSLYFGGTFEDDYGSLTYIFGLRPWGNRWEDAIANPNITIEATMHAFYEWYIPMIDAGWAMPDGYELQPTKTMEEREQELIDAAAGNSTSGTYSSDFDTSGSSDTESVGSTSAGGDSVNISSATVTGSSYTWGNITANVPDGMTATNGGIADRNDENSLWIQSGTKYLLITLCDEERAKSDVESTKNINGGTDAGVTIEGKTWTGTYYEYSGSPCWQIYTVVGGNCFEVMAYGYSFDSAEAQTVLSTVHHS